MSWLSAVALQAAWLCPLCGKLTLAETTNLAATRHVQRAHPATLPDRMTVPDMLALIARLVPEVALTQHAPNPAGEAGRTVRREPTTTPANLGAVAVLRADDGREGHSHVMLTRLAECGRIVWEALDMGTRAEHLPPDGLAWETETAWLAGAWPDALAYLDEPDLAWIEGEVSDMLHAFAALARMAKPTRYLCPECRTPMHMGVGDWLICETGAHEHPGPARLESEYRRRPPLSTQMIAEIFGIDQSLLWAWHKRGRIEPTNPGGKPLMWLPWDVVGVLYPDIVADINRRDSDTTA